MFTLVSCFLQVENKYGVCLTCRRVCMCYHQIDVCDVRGEIHLLSLQLHNLAGLKKNNGGVGEERRVEG